MKINWYNWKINVCDSPVLTRSSKSTNLLVTTIAFALNLHTEFDGITLYNSVKLLIFFKG